jgi:hypothetical protein
MFWAKTLIYFIFAESKKEIKDEDEGSDLALMKIEKIEPYYMVYDRFDNTKPPKAAKVFMDM